MTSKAQIHLMLSRYIARFDLEAEKLGITLTVSTDFEEFVECCELTPERLHPKPLFDPAHSDLTPDNSFWIKGLTREGEIAHMQAFKLVDLGDQPITRHLSDARFLYCDGSLGINLETSQISVNAQTEQVSGRACYQGEFWLKPGERGFRKKGLSTKLPRMGMALAFATWEPDYFYALPSIAVSLNGLVAQYGYQHIHPQGIRWKVEATDQIIDKYLIWISESEVIEMLHHS